MNHCVALAGAVSTAVLLATLTACSSDSDSSDDPIQGAPSGQPSASDSSSPSAPEPEPSTKDDGVDRPEIVLPESLELLIEPGGTNDPVEQSILYDNEQRISSIYAAMAAQDTQSPAISFYNGQGAQGRTVRVLERVIEDNTVTAGVVRYFKREVDILDEGSATVTYCRDFSGAYDVDVDTGEAVSEIEPDAEPTFYTERVELNAEGVWHAVEYGTEAGASECG